MSVEEAAVSEEEREGARRGDETPGRWAPHDHFPAVVIGALARQKDAYAHGVERPLGGYVAIWGVYAALVAALAALVRRRGCLPARVAWGDVALLTVATAKTSRIIAKDPVTSPLRAPFTRFEGRSGEAELAEQVRGEGVQHAAGELLTCPFCVGQWVGTVFAGAFAVAPSATRLAALAGTLVAGADVLQYGFAGLQRAWKATGS